MVSGGRIRSARSSWELCRSWLQPSVELSNKNQRSLCPARSKSVVAVGIRMAGPQGIPLVRVVSDMRTNELEKFGIKKWNRGIDKFAKFAAHLRGETRMIK